MIAGRISATATAPRSMAWRENLDGTQEVEAYAPSGATVMTPQPVYPGLFGYMSQLNTIATATGCWFYVGVPKDTYASGDWGQFIVQGYIASVTLASMTGTANLPMVWQSASGLVMVAASCSSSMMWRAATATQPCGIHRWQAGYDMSNTTTMTLTSSQAATSEHCIYLWGVPVMNNGG